MLRYKVKLNEPKGYNEIKCDELYLSPDMSFISGVTDYNYDLVDGQHLKIEFNENNIFHDVVVKTENVTRKGYVIFNQEFTLEIYKEYKGFYYIDGKYYFCGKDDTQISIMGKTYSITDNKIKMNVVYWVEDDKVVIGDNAYKVEIELDKDGNEIVNHYISMKGGKQLPITDCKKEFWKKVTKFYIRKNDDYNLKLDDASCAKKYPFFIYTTEKDLKENDETTLYNYNRNKHYLTFDKGADKFQVTVDDKLFVQDYGKVVCSDTNEEYNLEYEWRNTSSSNFLHLFLNAPQFNFVSGQKIIAESTSTISTKCDLYFSNGTSRTVGGDYILYCGKRYNESVDTIDFVSIYGSEYELIYTDSTHGYVMHNNKQIYFSINGTKATRITNSDSIKQEYNIVKYHYIKIDNNKFLIKEYARVKYDNSSKVDIASVDIIKKEKIILSVVDVISNSMLRCVVDVGDEDGDGSGACSVIASNYKAFSFKLLNPIFDEHNISKESFILAKSRGETEVFDVVKIFNPSFYIKLPMLVGNDISVNTLQEDTLENIFYANEIEKSINPHVDMEREIYYPCYKDGDKFFLINELQFDLHFRSRDLDTWKINEDTFTENEKKTLQVKCDWNLFDNYADYSLYTDDTKPAISTSVDLTYYQPADLLYFLNFNDNDVFYQKSKIAKSFLRLLFFDSMDVANQTLLYSCTVFMNENKLYKTYIDEINKKDNKYISVSEEMNEEEILTSTTISVYNDTCDDSENVTFDETKRLAATFNVKNRYETEESAEGFYLHIFKEYCEKLHEKTIYMKVEFNHAGQGRTINFSMPFAYDSDGMNPELLNLSPESGDLETFRQGYPLKELYSHLFIPINVVYDEKNKRYTYSLPNGLAKNTDKKKVMKFNLYEIKIKDES